MPRKRAYIYWLVLVVELALLMGYAQLRDLPGRFLAFQQSEEQVESLQAEVEELEQREKALEWRVEHMDTDPLESEALIRQGKNLVREGEKVYRIELDPPGGQ